MPGGVKQKPPVAVRPMGMLSIRRVFVCFEKPPHRCSAGVGKQAFPDALIGVELPVHNRLGGMMWAVWSRILSDGETPRWSDRVRLVGSHSVWQWWKPPCLPEASGRSDTVRTSTPTPLRSGWGLTRSTG